VLFRGYRALPYKNDLNAHAENQARLSRSAPACLVCTVFLSPSVSSNQISRARFQRSTRHAIQVEKATGQKCAHCALPFAHSPSPRNTMPSRRPHVSRHARKKATAQSRRKPPTRRARECTEYLQVNSARATATLKTDLANQTVWDTFRAVRNCIHILNTLASAGYYPLGYVAKKLPNKRDFPCSRCFTLPDFTRSKPLTINKVRDNQRLMNDARTDKNVRAPFFNCGI
jgi:hypothetical protein